MAEKLLEKETLNYEEVEALIGPPFNKDSRQMIESIDFEESLKHISEETKTL